MAALQVVRSKAVEGGGEDYYRGAGTMRIYGFGAFQPCG